ncbi:exodeoxyribonuclease III [Iamia sp. SCSIO 61187]|uniref:exodeoxyribonuclease III n=1 Tax=Iamia sp. SCSIO 61187 TaxID=2722752 RepID=UPI001C632DCE|nr:exodeoxyribonuclease III [Iamia sp. SCSIO 61187]
MISWNCNGLRSVIAKGVLEQLVVEEQPDVLLLQETRVQVEPPGLGFLDGYERTYNVADRPGYSGTAVFSRLPIAASREGLGRTLRDPEGRVLTVDLPGLTVVSAYATNARRDLSRLPERAAFDAALTRHLRTRARTRPVVLGGDLNVAPTAMDLARPTSNKGRSGCTDAERSAFQAHLDAGFVDAYRHLNPDGRDWTWWLNVSFARERDVGWRIDHWLVSRRLRSRLVAARALQHVRGSDHCPILLELATTPS